MAWAAGTRPCDGREAVLRYSDLPVGPLEQAERLEQLRALENGFKIRVVETEYESLGVDTTADLDRVNSLIQAMRNACGPEQQESAPGEDVEAVSAGAVRG